MELSTVYPQGVDKPLHGGGVDNVRWPGIYTREGVREMPKVTGRCWCCGLEYQASVLRIVRNAARNNRQYNTICSECQVNVAHAKTADEERKK